MAIVQCSVCGAKNRVDERRGEVARCGKCGAPLPAAAPVGATVVTDANFAAEVLTAVATPVLVDCWAAWCGPCRAIAPVIEQLARESAGRWKVGKLDVDANPQTARRFRIDSIPTLLIFKGGKLVDTLVGGQPKGNIEAKLRQWAGKVP